MKIVYQINEKRLINELEHNAKHKSKGVLNWYASLDNGAIVLNVLYDVYGVTYLYREFRDKVSPVVMMYIDGASMIEYPVPLVMPNNEVGSIQTGGF